MRAVGIVRVSRVAGREGESFASPAEQRQRIAAACERDGLELVETIDELDVSGGTPLSERQGLRGAVEAVEDGRAEVIVAAYFDRLMRSLDVQRELVDRVEAAGGRVMAVDVGSVSSATVGQWVAGTMLGVISEYTRRAARERSGAAQAMAVARGVVPWARIPPGYRRGEDGVLIPDPAESPVVAEAFRLRLSRRTITEVREHLRQHGIERSYHGTQSMLGSRVYLGEIHFGELRNLQAHEPIVDRDLWLAVQKVRTPRGPRPASDRILARLGVLRCGTCGGAMVVGSSHHGRYPIYRCGSKGDCPRRVTISAEIAERVIVDAVLDRHGEATGRASAERQSRDAAVKAERAQAELDSAIRAFSGLEDEAVAQERLSEMRAARDAAEEEAHRLRHLHSALVVNLAQDWPALSLDAKRQIIGAAVEAATVSPGRGADRVAVSLRP